MIEELNALKRELGAAVAKAGSVEELEQIEIVFLGRKGKLKALLKGLADVAAADRPQMGAMANEVKKECELAVASKRRDFEIERLVGLSKAENEDVTEPGLRPPEGHLHLMTQAIREITAIFEKIGFTRTRYPEVDWDWYAFEALNMPPEHPARDEWETFFMAAPPSKKGKMVLTPHATNGTARILAEKQFPIRNINIAKTYRRQIDMTHVPMFHQFDGAFVDKGVTVAHLRGLLGYFVKEFFGAQRTARMRPHHFRFTEPSFEVDVSCGVCGGTGFVAHGKCRTCKRGWVELGGAGMLHPNVLIAAGIDPKKYSGVAFGWGVERNYMMKEGLKLDDMRTLYRNDIRFLKQF